MKVGHKLLLIVVASVLLVVIPALAGIYLYLKHNLLANEAVTLTNETQTIVATNTQTLLGYEFSLKALSSTLEKTLAEPPKVEEAATFDRLIQRYPDNAWRNRREGFDGRTEAGVFLPPDAVLDAEQKSLHVRSKHLLDIYGTSITTAYGNIWLLTNDKTEVIYDHLYPEFAALIKADTDYTQTPWLTLGNPATNPKREVRWTPPMLDPVSSSWIISAVLPLHVKGKWIGTIGRDISITKTLPSLMQKSERYSGEQHLLMDAQGDFIDAGPWQKQLIAHPDTFKLDLTQEPDLAELLVHKEPSLNTHLYDKQVTINGREYLAIDAHMPNLDWRYMRLVPVNEILAPMRQLFYSLVGIVFAIGLLIGFLIDSAVQRNIIKRLQILADTVRRYGLGDMKARANLWGNDELAKTSQEFDTMAKRMESNERELNLVMNNIPVAASRVDNDFRYVYVSHQYMTVFAKSKEEILGHTMREILGEDLLEQEEPYARRAIAGETVKFEFKTDISGFGEMYGLVHFTPNMDEQNQVDGFFISVVDITELKKIQQDLMARDKRWKFAIEGFGDYLWDSNEVTRTITYSKAWIDILGYAEHEHNHKLDEWQSRVHPDDKAAVFTNLQKCLDEVTTTFECEYRIRTNNSSYKWIHDRGIVLDRNSNGKPLRMVGTISDISVRKQLEADLKAKDERLKFAIEGSGDGVWDWDIQSDAMEHSARWKEIIGYAPVDILPTGESWTNRFHPDDMARVEEEMRLYLEGKISTYRVECRIKCKDGSYKWILGRGMVVSRDEQGKPLRMIGTSTDISKRKQAELELSIAATAFESQQSILIADAERKIVRVNAAFTETIGYSDKEIIGQSIDILKSDKHDPAFYVEIWTTVKELGTWSGEVWNKRKNGDIYLGQLTLTAIKDDHDNVNYYVCTVLDITERKKAEEALIESEYRSKFAIEGSGDGVWDVNVQTEEATYSKRWAEMLGYEPSEILPTRGEWRALLHPEDKPRVIAAGNDYLDGKTEIYMVEYRIRCKDGHYKWMLSRGILVSRDENNNPLRMIGTQIDITERKLAEEKLKRMQRELLESHERYVDLYEFAPIGYLSITKHGMITEVNWKVTSMFGLQRKDINQHRFEEFVIEDDKKFWRRQFKMIKEMQGGEELSLSLKLAGANGAIFNANLHCLRMDDDEDQDQPILRVTLEDVTQLKQAEQLMQLREGYQRSLLDNFPFMVWLKDKKHRYLAVNQSFIEASEYDSEALLLGLTDLDVWPIELAKKYRSDDIAVLKNGVPKASEEIVEINGRKRWYEIYKSPVTIDGEVVGTVGFSRDINERKHAEMFEQFRSRVLELLIADLTLKDILEAIVLGVEQFNPEMLCSVLLIDAEGKHLVTMAAPSLPTFYNAAIDGTEIGEGVGSCGTSAFTGERVIVEDIATHPYWESYQDLAINSGLAACWSQPILAHSGKILGTFAIYHRHQTAPTPRDITLIEQSANLASIAIERKQGEDDLRIASIAFESQEGMMVTDAKNIILKVNQAFCDITGYTAQEAVGHTPRLLSSSQHSEGFYDAMWECVHATGHWAGEVYNRRKNGEVFPQHLTVTVVKDVYGIVTNHVATLTDITMNKAAAEEIKHLAFYDSLTGLPNRRLMVDRLNQALVFNARTGRDGAVLFLDLDHFKTLNDSLGHDVGDLLLQQVAERLVGCVREGDTVARLGGDEYVVLLESLSQDAPEAAAQVEVIGEKILASLNQAYQLGQHEYHCTPSIGVALFSNHNQSQEELLKHADIAMYQAKKAGRNTIRFFDPKMQEVINTRVDLERELRKAIDKQQLHLYYQIQVDLSGRSIGAEALIRWMHPEHGLVSPFHFISLAEETGLILPIGQWVLETACNQLKIWEKDEMTSSLTLSINVSAKQFRQTDFVNQVREALQRSEVNPMLLKLELTESMLLDNIEDTVTTMSRLKEIGIRFSLDDFGTGYSSLQYLKRLPLYQLKIDQSFVRDIAVDTSDQAIVRTIVAMAHTLNLNVIAEGVETEEQQGLLLNNGCTHFQGYYFGRPVPIEQFEVLVKSNLLRNS
ncbi:MAG: PAS domain S-box protein [Methylotenera sp.]|uniref:PAS domain S-box protein n=1 Tax=Methylotenera sp. TaxID=2051956 RepID=UPI002489AA74|nr:PAS domain S-box protein [Methylotenera sp.]MDI1308035.1 PAS domain S-box protein [Methylotenera sp.]